MASNLDSTAFEFGEDLFDFDELVRGIPQDPAEINAALDAVLETTGLAAQPDPAPAPAPAAVQPRPALPEPSFRAKVKPPPLGVGLLAVEEPAPAPRPVEEPASARAATFGPAAVAAAPSGNSTVLQRITLTPGLAVLLALIAALNLALVAYVVRALSSVESLVLDVGSQVISSSESVRSEASSLAEDLVASSSPVVAPRVEGLSALERAGDQFRSGEFEAGRQTLFALLAVIDRLPADVRPDIEARARFLLADSWRLEADALQGPTDLAAAGRVRRAVQ